MTNDNSVRLMLTGDNVVFTTDPKPTFFYENVVAKLKEADLRFGNLEWPLSMQGHIEPTKGQSEAGNRMDPSAIEAMKYAGYNVMSIANNHHMDYGTVASLETINLLRQAGIAYCGSGANIAEARKPTILTRKGLRMAFLAFTMVFMPNYTAGPDRHGISTIKISTTYLPPGRTNEQPAAPMLPVTVPDPKDKEVLIQAIKDAKKQADVVIVSFHWGVSGGYGKRVPYQMEIGRLCIDSGASLVVGHHPHMLQGVEAYKGGVICYSLGNFVFAGRHRGSEPNLAYGMESVIVDCLMGKEGLKKFSLIPVLINEKDQPTVLDANEGRLVLDMLRRDSREFRTVMGFEGDRIVVKL